MKSSVYPVALALAMFACTATAPIRAQSNDGYHKLQVVPLVVDTLSFTQTFTLHSPTDFDETVQFDYFPADGTSMKSSNGSCGSGARMGPYQLRQAASASFRTICAGWFSGGLPRGSQFGFAILTGVTGHLQPPDTHDTIFSAFTRVSNPLGLGFSVEAFPLSMFTSATTSVTGLRRKAATTSAPAYQSNCFIGDLGEITPSATPVVTPIHYTLTVGAGAGVYPPTRVVGTGDLELVPGQLIRILDIFAAAGAPAGDYDDAMITFEELGLDEPGILAYCTVQENSSYSADFRIAKQLLAHASPADSDGRIIGGQDDLARRGTRTVADGLGRPFAVPAGNFSNTHLLYFRHPDYISCFLVSSDPVFGILSTDDGLEMRLLDDSGNVLAGGNLTTGFVDLFLGDKTERNHGANGRYFIQVENSFENNGAARTYGLACASGSGHTLGDIVQYQEPVDRF